MTNKQIRNIAAALIAVLSVIFGSNYFKTSQEPSTSAGAAVIEELFEHRRSGVMVEFSGEVVKKLSDDNVGSRHQRFIVQLSHGQTVLIAHNIDLAPRVPINNYDHVEIYGQYEWNDKGGVVHWTHKDPDGDHEEGWIRHAGKIYH